MHGKEQSNSVNFKHGLNTKSNGLICRTVTFTRYLCSPKEFQLKFGLPRRLDSFRFFEQRTICRATIWVCKSVHTVLIIVPTMHCVRSAIYSTGERSTLNESKEQGTKHCHSNNNNYLVHCFIIMYLFLNYCNVCVFHTLFYVPFYKYLFHISVIYYAIACIWYVSKCNMYMYVNKRVELAQRGIAL